MVNNSMSKHRKIWQQHRGPIPRDESGRSLEIHHIDGDHSNNDISNLKLVTIEEHYEIHYDQGDWNACLRMSYRMGISPEEKSDLAKKNARKRVVEGTHHWVGPKHNQDLISRGIHPFLDREAARQRNLQRIAKGTHNLIGDANPVHGLIANGKHHFQNDNPVHKLLQSGSHAARIKLSCVFCKKLCSKNNFNRLHRNCGHEKI